MQGSETLGLFLLAEPGRRPSLAAVKDFAMESQVVAVSHDPQAPSSPLGKDITLTSPDGEAGAKGMALSGHWVELLRDGMTFDLHGLAPGAACAAPQPHHRFDWPTGQDAVGHEALHLGIGPHLAGAGRSLPVLRTMIALARDLALFFEEIAGVIWQPSASVIGRRFFESTATAWLDGGPFPALGLTAFEVAEDGALASKGLAFWIGQELAIEPALAQDKVAATRLGVRLVNHLVRLGGLAGEEHIVAPDGARLVMRPSADGRRIEVKRE